MYHIIRQVKTMGSDVRAKMRAAMVKLLEKKHYLQITVTDVVKEAGVARASFYRLYNSINDIIDDILKGITTSAARELVPILLEGGESSVKGAIMSVLEQFKSKEIPFIGMLPENAQMIIIRFSHRSIYDKNRSFDNIGKKYLPSMHLFLLVSVAVTWAFYGYKETTSELADFLYEYIYEGKPRSLF